ncbi:MAG: hypothetical protein K1X77_11640 [Bacteroidia bacterium]|nr:hypothetical protein [Bacteroidia bacterium]
MNLEQQYIQRNNLGEAPEVPYVFFLVSCEQPADKLIRVKEIINVIASQQKGEWPSDEKWNKLLPAWFINIISANTIEQVKLNPVLWDYSSWLDALKYREWEWYSSAILPYGFKVCCKINNPIYSINTLEYVIYATGIPQNHIKFTDFV